MNQEEAEIIRRRQANCKGHRERETWIGTMVAGSMTKVVGSVCAHCGISRSEYEATLAAFNNANTNSNLYLSARLWNLAASHRSNP